MIYYTTRNERKFTLSSKGPLLCRGNVVSPSPDKIHITTLVECTRREIIWYFVWRWGKIPQTSNWSSQILLLMWIRDIKSTPWYSNRNNSILNWKVIFFHVIIRFGFTWNRQTGSFNETNKIVGSTFPLAQCNSFIQERRLGYGQKPLRETFRSYFRIQSITFFGTSDMKYSCQFELFLFLNNNC